MKIVEDEGICTCCGRFTEFKYGEENFSLLNKDLANYKNYKDIQVFSCSNCGFVSVDITNEEGILFGKMKNTYEYEQLLNYAYLNGLDKELYDNHSDDIPANLYEAYSLVALQQNDYEKYIRLLNKAVELKIIMARKYKISGDEVGKEEGTLEDYKQLDNLIKLSIDTNRVQINHYYNLAEIKNVFLKLLYIENLVGMGNKQLAQQEFESLNKKIVLKTDLKEYFNNILS